jgi:hypothetical protein
LMVGWFSVDERDEPKSCMLFSSDWVPSLNFWLDMRWRPQSTPEMCTKSFSSPSWRHYSWDSVYYSCCSGSAYMYDGMSWVLHFVVQLPFLYLDVQLLFLYCDYG